MMNNTIICIIATWLFLNSSLSAAEYLEIKPSARYRFQHVNDDVRGDATAKTLKLRLSAAWRPNDYLRGFLQADHVHAFNEEDFSSVTVTRATSPIQDVPGSELNQAWVQYTSDTNLSIKLGRQHLGFESQRHISSVKFWQNDQVFDAVTFEYGEPSTWRLNYSYVNKVHRIFGKDAKPALPQQDIRFATNPNRPFLELGINNHNSHLFNASYQYSRYLGLSAYAYLLDNKSAPQFSSDTIGLRLKGEIKPSSIKYGYTAEIAHQQTAKQSPWNYDGIYMFAELSAQYRSHGFAIAHERLSENNGFAFATSLGDNHKFLGWADIFSSYTNTDGIRDTYLTYRGRKAKLRWRVVAHQFTSDSNGEVAGNELDFELGYRFNRKWETTIIASSYMTKGGIEGLIASQNDLSTFTLSVNYNL